MPIRNFLIIVIAGSVSLLCYEKAARNRYAGIMASAMQVIEDNYFEPVERRSLFENAMNGMLSGLDEYSSYIDPRTYAAFQQSIEQEFVGIGIIVDGPPNIEDLTVVSPVYDTPAYRAGLRAGDVILKIEGQDITGLPLDKAVDKIKGPRGSSVALQVRQHGETDAKTIAIERDMIRTRSVLGDTRREGGRWNYFLKDQPNIGYVRITTFGEHTVEELNEILQFKDHPVEALILDLRGNAGGLLSAAVEMSDMFLDSGTIVSTRGRRPEDGTSYQATPGTLVKKDMPLIVLVDRFSASASEIVAASLKDHGRAVIVGQRTWGKGTVQNVISLEGGRSALKLTTASYWRPNGENIHRGREDDESKPWGVRPHKDMLVELAEDQYREVWQQRRARDVLRDDNDTLPPDADALNDPQRDRAVDAVLGKLKKARQKTLRA